MTPADLAVIAATVLAGTSLVPQIVRLARTRDSEGVSVVWPGIGLAANLGWAAYLASQRLWAAVPSTVLMVAFYLLVVRFLARSGRSVTASWRAGLAWLAALAAAWALGGWGALGLVLGWSYAVQVAPSVWAAYRSPSPTGVSPGTWSIIGTEALLWGYYGWWFRDVPIIVFAAVGVTASALILARYQVTAARAPAEAPA